MSNRKARQRIAAVLASLACIAAAATAASPASATQYSATCATLQSDLNAAAADPQGGVGDTVTLAEMCGPSGENGGSYLLPSGSAFALEGVGGKAGFGATAIGGKAQLESPFGVDVGALTIAHLTFEGSAAASQGALVVRHSGGTMTLREDRFVKNMALSPSPVELTDDQTGCPANAANGGITVERSLFQEGTGAATAGGIGAGGGMLLSIQCGLDAFTLSHNEFIGDRLTPASGQSASGAGLAVYDGDSKNLAHATQLDNVFDSNAVVADGTSRYAGGGEDAVGVDLESTGDRFSRNALPGTSGSGNFSWGAGISIENSGCQTVSPTSTLVDAIVAANTIADSGADNAELAQGAGIYVGCPPPAGYSNTLTLLDSTVTNNAVTPAAASAVAGIDGHPSDHLSLQNTILWGDTGGAELGGFTGTGGSLAASYSDVCAGTGPLAGAGDICADPKLASDGMAGSFNVHESANSPTIDAGSNALVPAGLTTDAFGQPRITPGHASCTLSYPPLVDIGAAELLAVHNVFCAHKVPIVNFSFPSTKQLPNGVLRLTFKSPTRGHLSVKGDFTVTEVIRRHHKRIKRTRKLLYGRVAVSTPNSGNVSFDLIPTKAALKLLKRRKHLHVKCTATFAPASGTGGSKSKTVLVKYKAAPRKYRRHNKHG